MVFKCKIIIRGKILRNLINQRKVFNERWINKRVGQNDNNKSGSG